MPSTLCSLWAGIDDEAFRKGGAFSHNDEKMPALLEAAFRSGELSEEDYHHTGIFPTNECAETGNITHVFDIDSADERSLTGGLIRNRRLLREYENFYRRRIDGFSRAEIVSSGSLLGIRESRRIKCEYMLTRADYEARRSFEDEIGRYSCPADIHPSHQGREEIEAHRELRHSLPLASSAWTARDAGLRTLYRRRPSHVLFRAHDSGMLHYGTGCRRGRCACC